MKNEYFSFNPGLDIYPTKNPLGFRYGKSVFGPKVENRRIEDIRKSLKDPNCDAGDLDVVYTIAMDVGRIEDKSKLEKLHLLYGCVTYASGKLGDEPIRSQGHIHSISKYSGQSTAEVYEIWNGKAIIYMQERVEKSPGKCYAVYAEVGEVVIVPPGWGHATISADPNQTLTFGAWCIRDYAFEYNKVRSYAGLSWFPILKNYKIDWVSNKNYNESELIKKKPREYKEFGITKGIPIYEQFMKCNDKFSFVTDPKIETGIWENFIP
jgi:glucose-6-phosphate isomerase